MPTLAAVRRYVYWPSQPVPWLLGLLLTALAGALGLDDIASKVPTSTHLPLLAVLLLVAAGLNILALARRLEDFYATWPLERGPLVATFLLLAIVATACWGTTLALRGTARLAWFGGLRLDIPITLRCLLLGQVATLAMIGAERTWPTPEVKVGDVAAYRDRALQLLERLCDRGRLEPEEKKTLDVALGRVASEAAIRAAGIQHAASARLVADWGRASQTLAPYFARLDARDLSRATCSDVKPAIDMLRREE